MSIVFKPGKVDAFEQMKCHNPTYGLFDTLVKTFLL